LNGGGKGGEGRGGGGVGAGLDGGREISEEGQGGACDCEGAKLLPLVDGIVELFCRGCCVDVPGRVG